MGDLYGGLLRVGLAHRADSNLFRVWCERGDLNPHGLLRQILSLVRLPISPLSHLLPRLFMYLQDTNYQRSSIGTVQAL